MIVHELIVFPAKGEPGRSVPEARCSAGRGLEGDFHADGGLRQLSLLPREILRRMEESPEKGLCFSRFKANLITEGEIPFRAGVRLRAGEAVLEVTEENKHCHGVCPLFSQGRPCFLTGQSFFARVVGGGILRVGDPVEVVAP